MKVAVGSLVVVVMLAAGCDGDQQNQCELGTVSRQVQAADRKILGAGASYGANGMLRGMADELHRSQNLRRQVAWQTVGKVLAPVALAEPLPNVADPMQPAWHTWYAKDDVTRLFQHLYEGLDPAQQQMRQRFDQASIDTAFGWNVSDVETQIGWPQDRWLAYLSAIDSADKIAGIGGLSTVAYSPAATRHLMRSYPEVLSCIAGSVAEPFTDTPGDAVQQAVREPLALGMCASRTFGPYFVSEGETLTASLAGVTGGARLVVFSDDNPALCESRDGAACQAVGSGATYVTAWADEQPITGTIQIDYATPNAAWANCLDGAFPQNAVVIKTGWHRAQFGMLVPTYDTTADALTATMLSNPATGWGSPARDTDPGPDSIYTMELPNGNRFRLAALHIMTKELDHWQWITLWWSDTPDVDFGADRPAEIATLPGPWKNYKMCVVTMFDERDPDATGGFGTSAPTLAAALASVHGGVGSASWCSNPYLEEGPGNAATNCIGCHQHGGTDLASAAIIGTPDQFPAHGRTLLRNNFPTDYSWAVNGGDRLNLSFKQVVDYYDAQ